MYLFRFIRIKSCVLTDCILIDAYYIYTTGLTHITVVLLLLLLLLNLFILITTTTKATMPTNFFVEVL